MFVCFTVHARATVRSLSVKFPIISRKNFPFLSCRYSALSSSKYSPLLCMHRCQRFFNVLKHSWKYVLWMLRKCASEFVLMASVDSKRRLFSVDLMYGNRKKSAGARSVRKIPEYIAKSFPVLHWSYSALSPSKKLPSTLYAPLPAFLQCSEAFLESCFRNAAQMR